jgi:signal transduction histidine kinase/ActR/RegA family two-component response regulator
MDSTQAPEPASAPSRSIGALYLQHWVLLFAVGGFLVMAATLWITSAFVQKTTMDSVLSSTEAANFALSEVFVSEVWDDLTPLLPAQEASPQDIRTNPNLAAIDARIRQFNRNTDIVKIKVFDLRGLTLYSSDYAQLAEDQSASAGFSQALAGNAASEMSFRDQFNAFGGRLTERTLVSSYIPVHVGPLTVAVVEIYSDRTPTVQHTEGQLRRLIAVMCSIVLAVYLLLMYFVLQAEKARRRHAAALTRAAQESEAAQRLADEANAGKTAFLATMSHEIRTPMNGVLGMAGLLLDSPLTPAQREHAQSIAYSGEALLAIINDILDLSKIEAGRMEFERHVFAISPLVDAVGSLLAVRAREKKLNLHLELDPALPVAFEGDSARIRQVLLNLMSNAIKFTEQGTVTTRVRSCERGVRFEVIDTGIGLSIEGIQKLFAEFAQADASTTRKFGGTGLGLAICKRLTEGMGGTIGVESAEGKGSVFWFELPLRPASESELETIQTASVPALPTGQTQPAALSSSLLLVEDNAINQKLALTLLGRLGLQADLAQNGQEALEAVQKKHYDLVLMDMQMPVMDGLEATRQIRQLGGAFATLPIVALTANAMQADKDACTAAGMNSFLTKPFNRETLRTSIAQWRSPSERNRTTLPGCAR